MSSTFSAVPALKWHIAFTSRLVKVLFLRFCVQVKLPRYASKNLEIKRELRKMDERAFFLDVVKDIANDLDLKSLTKKITENLAVLLDAEAASLFLVEGPKGKQTLVSKVTEFRPFVGRFALCGHIKYASRSFLYPRLSFWTPNEMLGAKYSICGWNK